MNSNLITVEDIQKRFGILGESDQLKEILKLLPQIAKTDISVLITGESGTGKESIANAIHGLSQRSAEKLVIVNCGAIPEGILESELFGHEKGAFTGAIESRKGYFELADKGTLFLDEIGDMPMGVQVKILRVLETGDYMRVGGSTVKKTDVRIIGATNKNLLHEVQNKKFREDLYYRLRAVQISMPALQDRKVDIPILFQSFWREFTRKYGIHPEGVTRDAIQLLANYHWPGNIRELRNLTESMLVLDGNKMIDDKIVRKYLVQYSTSDAMNKLPVLSDKSSGKMEVELLYRMLLDIKAEIMDIKSMLRHLTTQTPVVVPRPADFHETAPSKLLPETVHRHSDYTEIVSETDQEDEHPVTLTDMEKKAIEEALTRHLGNRRKAADELQISERTLYRKIKEYGLE